MFFLARSAGRRSFEPDVVVLDIALPVVDGHELAARIHERLGIVKPVSTDELLAVMHEMR